MEFMNLQGFLDEPDKLFITFMEEIPASGQFSIMGKLLDIYDREHRTLSGWSRFGSPTAVDVKKLGMHGKIAIQGLYEVMYSQNNGPNFRYAVNNRYIYRLHMLVSNKFSTKAGVFTLSKPITEELRLFLARPREDNRTPLLDLLGTMLAYSWEDNDRARANLKSAAEAYVPQVFLPYLLG